MKSLLILVILNVSLINLPKTEIPTTLPTIEMEGTDDAKKQAFEILKANCNVCHQEKNKKRVFTFDNMDKYSKKIYKQVFKWKRMPKGDDIKLTPQEYEQLKNWISSTKNK